MNDLRRGPLVGVVLVASLATSAFGQASARRKDQDALKAYGPLVGEWKGTGQVQRGSGKGAWRESAAWAWKLKPDSAALEVTFDQGKYLKSALLKPGTEAGTLVFDATLADGSKRTFEGKPGKNDVIVLTGKDGSEGVRRITLTPLHDTRLLMLLEGQGTAEGALKRLGEVGYTRQGVAFATGESYPICIVTEGRGTIQVQHRGKTYWVCCTGCKDLFDEDPAAVIAEAEARKKAKKDK